MIKLPKKILVTGVAGFLGSHLSEKLAALGHKVIGIDNMMGGYRDNVPKNIEFFDLDCCDFNKMNSIMKGVDVVYHCAATAHEGLSVFSPVEITKNNYLASVSVFTAAISNKVKRIIFCSSMARYGSQNSPFTEIMKPQPVDPYAISKVAAEQVLINLCDLNKIEWVIAVPHNIIGPKQKYDDPFRNVVSIMINRILNGNPPIVYGDGSQERCFSDIEDVVNPIIESIHNEKAVGETINIGPDEEFGPYDSHEEAMNGIERVMQKVISLQDGHTREFPRPYQGRRGSGFGLRAEDIYLTVGEAFDASLAEIRADVEAIQPRSKDLSEITVEDYEKTKQVYQRFMIPAGITGDIVRDGWYYETEPIYRWSDMFTLPAGAEEEWQQKIDAGKKICLHLNGR